MRHFKGLGFQGVSPTLEGAEGVCSQCENHMVFSIAYPFNQSQEPPRCMNAEDRDPQCPVRGIRWDCHFASRLLNPIQPPKRGNAIKDENDLYLWSSRCDCCWYVIGGGGGGGPGWAMYGDVPDHVAGGESPSRAVRARSMIPLLSPSGFGLAWLPSGQTWTNRRLFQWLLTIQWLEPKSILVKSLSVFFYSIPPLDTAVNLRSLSNFILTHFYWAT